MGAKQSKQRKDVEPSILDLDTPMRMELEKAEEQSHRPVSKYAQHRAKQPRARWCSCRRLSPLGILLALLPSFVRNGFRKRLVRPDTSHPTAWLDGLRGVASLFVCWTHMSYVIFVLGHGYGHLTLFGPEQNIMQLPFIRLIYGGASMVAIFFVISGYALSVKPLKLMHSRSYNTFATTLSSSVFRRAFRLFLPPIASTFIVLILVQFRFYEATLPVVSNPTLLRNKYEFHQPRFSLPTQLYDWTHSMFNFVFVWSFDMDARGTTGYDWHLWTIPVEFRASMVLFLTHFCTMRMRPAIRLGVLAGVSWWAIVWFRWEMTLFWAGMAIAELDLLRTPPKAPGSEALPIGSEPPPPRRRHRMMWSLFWIANLLCGMYLCSYPEDGADLTPGFVTLRWLVPTYYGQDYRFWQGWGAVQIVWAISNAHFLQRVFTTRPIQYLGNVSYAIYLMHGPVLHTFGYTIEPLWWNWTGTEPGSFELGFFLAACCNTLAIIWAGDLFWRFVDVPCVRFARWLETKCINSP